MAQGKTLLERIIIVTLCFAGSYLFLRFLLRPLFPFLLALGTCALLEPTVQRIRQRMKVRRSFAAVLLISGILLIAGGGAALLALRLGVELTGWSQQLPDAIQSFPAVWNSVLDRIETWYSVCPPFLRSALDLLADALNENTTALVTATGSFLMERISGLAAGLPGAGLFLMTLILALYFTAVNYHSVLGFLKRQLPPPWQIRCRAAAQCFRATILRWLLSEALLLCATFLILLIGFWWIETDFVLLKAFSIALVDAFPVLGTGTVLLPWAVFSLAAGNLKQGVSLIALYAATLLTHSLLEPRLLAGQADLPPLAVLLAIYLGFHFFGVGGMILLPFLLLLSKKMQDAGVIKLWK